MQLIFHMKRFKTILKKIEQRSKNLQNTTNPFEKLNFKDIVNTSTLIQDKTKIERIFQKTEMKLEEFYEQKKKYYKNIRH